MERGTVVRVVIIIGAAVLVLMMAERGIFRRFGNSTGFVASVPSLTVGDAAGENMPVVTSVRSDGAAARAGIRVGDEIEAVDGTQVHNVAGLRAAISADHGNGPLALHIRRGDALWTIAIDRSEGAGDKTAVTGG